MCSTETPSLVCCTEARRGRYMFILQDDFCQVGMPKFSKTYFCVNQEEMCSSNNNQDESLCRMMKAATMIRSYAKQEEIDARVYVVQYELENDGKIFYACMIGPLYLFSKDDLEKVEKYVLNEIAWVTSNMIRYQRKYSGYSKDPRFVQETILPCLPRDMEGVLMNEEYMDCDDTDYADNTIVPESNDVDCDGYNESCPELYRIPIQAMESTEEQRSGTLHGHCLVWNTMHKGDENKENIEPCTC